MSGGWLTAKVVEDVQHAVTAGVGVAQSVSGLAGATLPGVLEYGCLRWLVNDDSMVPPLPPAILDSPLGRAALAVRSEVGPRAAGPQKRPLNRVTAREAEFHVLDGEAGLVDHGWELFEVRFDRSAQAAGFGPQAAHGLQAALHEMAENAVLHAQSPVPVLVGYHAVPGAATFCVADVGVGVLASLRSHPAYGHLHLHNEAIRAALRDGTSRYGPRRGGFGFRRVFKSLAERYGHLRFRSGEGCITMAGDRLDADRGDEEFMPPLPGFQVTVCCRVGESSPASPLV